MFFFQQNRGKQPSLQGGFEISADKTIAYPAGEVTLSRDNRVCRLAFPNVHRPFLTEMVRYPGTDQNDDKAGMKQKRSPFPDR